ncbi:uncharacterized protein LOC111687185 isoform X8 [Lucilia cuprina]|uniref:uncharacterized protein LOC111687185 isoform X8 n=1 Tax=Lucilia cuprina TaxID=7375 RepID=UPI001F06189E|nr:uncharacterized protein LOC111687185 isoform X8 [Lucilia cuprina]
MFVFIIVILIVNACIAGTIPATPENITVAFLTPTTVRVSWQTMIDLNAHPVEKYIVTYKPTDDSYRVVQNVAGNSEAIILDRLTPGTQYSIGVTAVWLGKKYRSRQVIFRTLDLPKAFTQDLTNAGSGPNGGMSLGGATNFSGHSSANGSEDGVTSTATNSLSHGTHRELPTIRGVEIGIVLIVLMVWAGAIALFFNRWGKIRMLLPYQPDYKHEQLKVPGTGVCSGGVCNGQHSHQKSFAENRQWHTDDSNGNDAQHDNGIEMHECSRSVENHPVAILKTNVEKLLAATSVLSHSAAVTTSNKVVGSISIETPPSHIREEQNNAVAIPVPPIPPPLPPPLPHPTLSSAKTVSLNSASHDSADTVEELVSIPYDVATTMSPAINSMPKTSKVLVRQRSSTASPVLSSAHSSPKALKLKCITPKLSNLPMVSVSGPSPSPSDEKPPPGECL